MSTGDVLYDWLAAPDHANRKLVVYQIEGPDRYMAEIRRDGFVLQPLVEWCAAKTPRGAVEGLAQILRHRDRPEAT